MKSSIAIITVFLVALLGAFGFLLHQRLFVPSPLSVIHTGTVTTNGSGNTNSVGKIRTLQPPTAKEVQNMQVIMDFTTGLENPNSDGRLWARIKEAKAGFTSNGGTMFYIDMEVSNKSSQPLDLNLVSRRHPAISLSIPKSDFPAGVLPANAANTITVIPGSESGTMYHMPFTPDVKIAPGKSGEIKVPMWIPGKFTQADVLDANFIVQVYWNGGSTGMPFMNSLS